MMVLAAQPEGIFAADVEVMSQHRVLAERGRVPAHRLLGDLGKADALDRGRRAEEEAVHEVGREADRVEDLRAAIGLVGRDAHLGHDLQHAFADRLDVAVDDLAGVDDLGELALGMHGEQRLEGEIGVDRLRAVAGEHAELVHLARLAGLDDQADRRAQSLADQVVVDGGRGEHGRDGDAPRADQPVGEDDDVVAVEHRALGTAAKPRQRHVHSRRAALDGVGDVERLRLEMVVGDVADGADLLQVLVGEDRLAHFEALALRQALQVEKVRPRPDERDEAHHRFFADRVDRRVRDLREILLEVVVEQFWLAREHRDGRVGAHRADGFLAGRRHRRHQELQVFLAVAERLLPIEQRGVGGRRARADGRKLLQHDLRAGQPLAVGVGARQPPLQLVVGDDAALFEVDQQHLAGLQPPLGDDLLVRHRQHADFRRHDDQAVVGDDVARRAEPVAVERRGDLAAVGEGDRRRPVPRLHDRGVVLVEGAPLLVHERVAGPGLGDQRHRRMRQLVAADR